MKRIFIALKVEADETLKRMILSFKSGLKNDKIRWTNLANIHITLAFLGDTEEEKINSIIAMLVEKCEVFERFELVIKGSGVYKSLSNPRIIWTGIEPSENLKQLYNFIIIGLNGEGFNLEDRSFNPHLTLGRIKYLTNRAALITLLGKYQDKEIQKVQVNEVILYESILKPKSPLYKPVSIIKLR